MLLASFRLEPGAVALEQTLDDLPNAEFEAERIAAHSTTWTMPYLWATHPDFDAVDAALAEDSSVEEIVETDEFDAEKYYQIKWTEEVERRLDTYLDTRASLISAQATADGWDVRLRLAHREQFDVFREALQERGCTFDLHSLTEPGEPRQSVASLTSEQRDALVAALEHGCYDIPREATVQDLAENLGKSHQAVSELLRRGTKKVFDETLTTDGTDASMQS